MPCLLLTLFSAFLFLHDVPLWSVGWVKRNAMYGLRPLQRLNRGAEVQQVCLLVPEMYRPVRRLGTLICGAQHAPCWRCDHTLVQRRMALCQSNDSISNGKMNKEEEPAVGGIVSAAVLHQA